MTKIAARPPGAARRAPYKPSSFLKCLNAAAKIRCSSFFAISGANFLVLETPVRIELMPRINSPRLSHESAAAVSDNMATASRHLVDEQEDLDPFLDHGGRRKSKPELGEHVFSDRDLLVVLPRCEASQECGRHCRERGGVLFHIANGQGALQHFIARLGPPRRSGWALL